MFVTATLLSEERLSRLDAARMVELDSDGIHALRNALVTDEDAEVRSVAAERLGLAQVARAAGYLAVKVALLDATSDASVHVRERAVVSLGRHLELSNGSESLDRLRALVVGRLGEMLRTETSWRARRAAVRAIASVAGESAIPELVGVLSDPFWRVRYAAIQALVAWPQCEAVLGSAQTAQQTLAVAFLRSIWRGERVVDLSVAEPERVQGVDASISSDLSDEDPAVVAVRLARLSDSSVQDSELVPLLSSPHDVLRRLAIKRLVTRARDDELLAAIALLAEPRAPYVCEAVARVLARSDGRRLRDVVLGQTDPPAEPTALVWAFEQAATSTDDVSPHAMKHLSHADVRVRRAAARAAALVDTRVLTDALGDSDDLVRATCIEWLTQRLDEPSALAALEALEAFIHSPCVSRALMAVCARGDAPTDLARTLAQRASRAWDASTRSAAIAWLTGAGEMPPAELDEARHDADPWIRLAALDASCAPASLETDPDPSVRRHAFDVVIRHAHDPSVMVRAALSDDAWVRTRAATLLAHAPDAIEPLLRLTRDHTMMVRSAAAAALLGRKDVSFACFEVVAREPPVDDELRLAAHGQLVREGSARAFEALERDVTTRRLSAQTHWTLRGMSLAYPDELRAGSELTFEPRPPIVRVERSYPLVASARELGRTGIRVSPLAISGAFDLPVSCLERARETGVNAFFWEPEHRTMSEFLRRADKKEDVVVIAGSYEADGATITKDVDRALKRLGRESLGVMLLFWVRSAARLNDESFECLSRLKAAGKVRAIGFSTHMRELAAEAITARPWDVVMSRHSAAHTGLEASVLPVARERGVGVVTFSALVYGRMLAPSPSGSRFDAADCYRYCLSQDGVSVCLSAPRRQRELEENLGVVRAPTLAPEVMARMREHGLRVRADNRAFMSLVREP